MLIRLELSSAAPIYRQIVNQVKYQIASGMLRPGDRLPSVRELAQRLPANQNTVLKAYDLLAREHLVNRRPGEGSFILDGVSSLKKSARLRQTAEIFGQAAAQCLQSGVSEKEAHDLLDQEFQKLSKGRKGHE
ncbi:MAG: GntR family transcriptional regulator [Verrucomicrobia bacterium]|nr:GntR family transcriptional regulator [Verrucomicrobiota bacterium]